MEIKHIIMIVVAFILLMLLAGSCGIVKTGYMGVRTRLGVVAGDQNAGLYFKVPIIEKVVKMDVRVQKVEVVASAASKDLQQVKTTIALNYKLKMNSATYVFSKIGLNYKVIKIDPAIQEAVKSNTAKFTAEQLIADREKVRSGIEIKLIEKLGSFLDIDAVNIVEFDFSDSFNLAIEKKVTAEQDALAAKNKLEQIKFEAQQKVEEAKGKAEAMMVEVKALQSNQQILQLRALEKWDGKLPIYLGAGAVPFLDIKQ